MPRFKYGQKVWIKAHRDYANVMAIYKGTAGKGIAQVRPLAKRPPLGYYIDLLYVPINDLGAPRVKG